MDDTMDGNGQQPSKAPLVPPLTQNGRLIFSRHNPDMAKAKALKRPDTLTFAAQMRAAPPPPPRDPNEPQLLPRRYLNDPMRAASQIQRPRTGPISKYKLATSKRSRVASIDLEAFLKDDRVWNSLSAAQQKAIVDRFGLGSVYTITPNEDGKYPNIWTLGEDKEYLVVEDVVEKFQKHLSAGHLDPEYRSEAKIARFRRARGDFVRETKEESEESPSSPSSEADEDGLSDGDELADDRDA